MSIGKIELKKHILSLCPYLATNISRLDNILDCIYSLDSSFEILINKLAHPPRNFESFLAEANMIYEINQALSKSNVSFDMLYEQSALNGKPDLKILLDNDIILWVQLKCFSTNEIDKKRNIAIEHLKYYLEDNYSNYFHIKTSYNLNVKTVNMFTEEIRNLGYPTTYKYEDNYEKIEIEANQNGEHLIQYSGMIKDQYRLQVIKSFEKAMSSFSKNDDKNINIIVCQNLDDIELIDIDFAIYGTDAVKYTSEGEVLVRCDNGIINSKQKHEIVNYYLSYNSNHMILGICDKFLFKLNVNNTMNIGEIFGIPNENIIDKDTYIP